MKYYEVKFTISAPAALLPDVRDVVAALAGDAGFETFEETPAGLTGYIQQSLFDDEALSQLLAQVPFDGVSIGYDLAEAEHRDWNEQWENEGFVPVSVGRRLVIHDGRHLPPSAGPGQLLVQIDARLAFGTGNHETTRMMALALTELSLTGCRVLDCGTGTGVLAIVALLCGADRAVGYDIDEWSVDNARHNAALNGVQQRFDVYLGDAAVIGSLGQFDVVTANINRNILLADLPHFASAMKPGATLLLSGFYRADQPQLADRARALGLALTAPHHDGDWCCLEFQYRP